MEELEEEGLGGVRRDDSDMRGRDDVPGRE